MHCSCQALKTQGAVSSDKWIFKGLKLFFKGFAITLGLCNNVLGKQCRAEQKPLSKLWVLRLGDGLRCRLFKNPRDWLLPCAGGSVDDMSTSTSSEAQWTVI